MFTLANKITIARILFIPFFMFFLLSKSIQPIGSYMAVLVFTLAALTDTVDGYVARFQRQVTTFGKFLDPLADKLLISTALVALVELNQLAAWVAMIIIAREFAVSGLRLMAMARGKIIAASTLGKLKTTSQIIAIIAIVLNAPYLFLGKSLGWHLMALAVMLTVASGIEYFIKTKDVLLGAGR